MKQIIIFIICLLTALMSKAQSFEYTEIEFEREMDINPFILTEFTIGSDTLTKWDGYSLQTQKFPIYDIIEDEIEIVVYVMFDDVQAYWIFSKHIDRAIYVYDGDVVETYLKNN